MTAPLSFDPATPYRELREPPLPDAVRELALACFAAQRRAGAAATALDGDGDGVGREAAARAVSEAELARLLADGRTVGGIVTQREVATAIPFNARLASDVVWSRDVAAHRRRLDRALARWVPALFAPGARPLLLAAGQWWYPPGRTSAGTPTTATSAGASISAGRRSRSARSSATATRRAERW